MAITFASAADAAHGQTAPFANYVRAKRGQQQSHDPLRAEVSVLLPLGIAFLITYPVAGSLVAALAISTGVVTAFLIVVALVRAARKPAAETSGYADALADIVKRRHPELDDDQAEQVAGFAADTLEAFTSYQPSKDQRGVVFYLDSTTGDITISEDSTPPVDNPDVKRRMGGGTLFERMSRLSRGVADSSPEEGGNESRSQQAKAPKGRSEL